MSITNVPYFKPTSIGGCSLWLDGADPAGTGTAPSAGATVSTWIDKSGNGYNFSNGSRAAPTFATNALSFTGSGTNGADTQVLSNSSIPLTTTYSIFAVAAQNASHPSYTGYNYILTANTTVNQYLNFGTTSEYFATFTGYTSPSTAFNDTSANSPNTKVLTQTLLNVTNDNTTLRPYLNGTAMTTKTGTTNSVTGVVVGDAATLTYSGQNWNGKISEIIIYNSVLGITQRQTVEAYLAQKWGLTGSLPTDHPGNTTLQYRSPTFSPTQLPGCAIWLDAADSNTFTGSAPVTAWRDKANGYSFAGTATTASSIGGTTIGCLSFNASSQYLTFSNSSTILTPPYTVYTVGYQLNNALGRIVNGLRPGSTDAVLYVGGWSGSVGTAFVGDGGNWNPYPDTAGSTRFGNTVNTWAITCCTVSNTASQSILNSYFNGVTQAVQTGSILASSLGGMNIGGGIGITNGGQSWYGYIGEVIFYNYVLSVSQRQQVEGYLAKKWALASSLSTDHLGSTSVAFKNSSSLLTPIPYTSLPYAFAPTQISNCQLWLDSYDPLGTGTPPSYGATFTTLADKSGNARNFSVNTGNTYYCNYESRPSIFISNSIMYASNAVDLRNYSFFIVCQSSNYADNQTTFVAMTGAAGCNDYNSLDAFGFYVDAVTNRNRFYASINTNVVYNYFTPVGANYYPLSLTCFTSTSAGSALSYANGNTGGSQNSSITRTGTATGFAIGCDYLNDATKFYSTSPKVFINEIIVYNFVLSDTQRRQVEAYLTQKWTLSASLPSGHTGLTVPYYVNQSIVSRAALINPVPTLLTTGSATGGTITTANGYRTHSFTSVGSINFVITGSLKLQVLIVGGGGGGGFTNCAGGGGAGGAVATILVIPTGTYSVTVGAGGTGGNYTASVLTQAANGNDSTFYGITCLGGGYGGWVGSPRSGASGGCGGGGSYAGGVGSGGAGLQGGNGGRGSTLGTENNSGGGGGGMGGDGGLPNLVGGFSGGAGGLGATYVIGGTSYTVSGGGGGGTDATAGTGGSGIGGVGGCPSVSSGAAGNGTANTGSGGGGGGGGFANTTGGNGGSGIVVISYVYP